MICLRAIDKYRIFMYDERRTTRGGEGLKRIAALTIILLLIFFGIPCAADSGFYCEYSPKTEKSNVFYIDIYSTVDTSAAVMELGFDESFAEFREVSAAEKSTSVRSAKENGAVKIALADSGAIKGKLCRVAFKALQAGTCTFDLHISQAADSEPKLIGAFPDSSIEVKLGKDDIAAGSASTASSKTSSKNDKNGSSSKSYLNEASESDVYVDPATGEVIDLRKNHAVKYILIGAGIVVLFAALIYAGVLIGRKTAGKKKKAVSEEPNESEVAEEPSESKAAEEPTENEETEQG